MAHLYETLSPADQLHLALHLHTPTWLAQTFATHVGGFYDRSAFDRLARQLGEIYDNESPDEGCTFRTQLDRRLCDHFHAPVAWDTAAVGSGEAA